MGIALTDLPVLMLRQAQHEEFVGARPAPVILILSFLIPSVSRTKDEERAET